MVARHTRIVPEVACPPATSRPYIKIWAPTGTTRWPVAALGERLHGHMVHYDAELAGGRTVPCMVGSEACRYCRQGRTPRWKGYLAGLILPGRHVRIVEVTAGAYNNCPALRELQGRLRGRLLYFQRMSGGKNAPVKITVAEQPVAERELPPPFDVYAALGRVWDIDTGEGVPLGELADGAEEIDELARRFKID